MRLPVVTRSLAADGTARPHFITRVRHPSLPGSNHANFRCAFEVMLVQVIFRGYIFRPCFVGLCQQSKLDERKGAESV